MSQSDLKQLFPVLGTGTLKFFVAVYHLGVGQRLPVLQINLRVMPFSEAPCGVKIWIIAVLVTEQAGSIRIQYVDDQSEIEGVFVFHHLNNTDSGVAFTQYLEADIA